MRKLFITMFLKTRIGWSILLTYTRSFVEHILVNSLQAVDEQNIVIDDVIANSNTKIFL